MVWIIQEQPENIVEPTKVIEVVQASSSPTVSDKINTLSQKYGVPVQIAKDIIRCESQTKPHAVRRNYRTNSNGEKYVWSSDWSYWQINDFYWEEFLLKNKGWDIHDPEDNLEAGFWIYSQYGSQPWSWSKHCHGH